MERLSKSGIVFKSKPDKKTFEINWCGISITIGII